MPAKCGLLLGYLLSLSLLSLLNIKVKLPAVVVEICRKYYGRLTNLIMFRL